MSEAKSAVDSIPQPIKEFVANFHDIFKELMQAKRVNLVSLDKYQDVIWDFYRHLNESLYSCSASKSYSKIDRGCIFNTTKSLGNSDAKMFIAGYWIHMRLYKPLPKKDRFDMYWMDIPIHLAGIDDKFIGSNIRESVSESYNKSDSKDNFKYKLTNLQYCVLNDNVYNALRFCGLKYGRTLFWEDDSTLVVHAPELLQRV